MRVLAVNAGSSSIKLRVVGAGDEVLGSRDLTFSGGEPDADALRAALSDLPRADAVGHRFVHGGTELREAALADDEVLAALERAVPLAPLHNAAALALLRLLRAEPPDLPHVVCLDTAFHRTLPDEAAVYPVPWDWTERHGLRRLGFHGFSHAYASRRTADLLGRPLGDLRLVTCHLGAGASLAAVKGGASVDTTMGFTPNEGLMMATRSGSVDPGALLWLMREHSLSAGEADHALEHEAGLLGVSGVSGDIRAVIDAAERDEPRARLALGIYLHRLRAAVAAMSAAMEGIDALVFTGGVGEHSARVREEACKGLGFLGVEMDPELNGGKGDRIVSPDGALAAVLVVAAREEVGIAAEVRAALR